MVLFQHVLRSGEEGISTGCSRFCSYLGFREGSRDQFSCDVILDGKDKTVHTWKIEKYPLEVRGTVAPCRLLHCCYVAYVADARLTVTSAHHTLVTLSCLLSSHMLQSLLNSSRETKRDSCRKNCTCTML